MAKWSSPRALLGLVGVLSIWGVSCGEPPSAQLSAQRSNSDAPTSIEITCHKDGSTTLSGNVVQVQSDGIHFEVDNRSGDSASINGFAVDVSEGKSTNVSTFAAPGTVEVTCWPFHLHGKDEPRAHSVDVVDPKGLWVNSELECPPGKGSGMAESSIMDFIDTSKSEHDDPIAAARAFFRNLESQDEIQLAGYPDQSPPRVRIVRGEYVLASAGFLEADDGGVILEGYSLCANSGIRTKY